MKIYRVRNIQSLKDYRVDISSFQMVVCVRKLVTWFHVPGIDVTT